MKAAVFTKMVYVQLSFRHRNFRIAVKNEAVQQYHCMLLNTAVAHIDD